MVEIIFDPEKERRNFRKHGLNFSLADILLSDPLGLTLYDRFEGGEHRWHTIASPGHGRRVLVVVHTDPAPEDGGPIRIIGLRLAIPRERRLYEDGPN